MAREEIRVSCGRDLVPIIAPNMNKSHTFALHLELYMPMLPSSPNKSSPHDYFSLEQYAGREAFARNPRRDYHTSRWPWYMSDSWERVWDLIEPAIELGRQLRAAARVPRSGVSRSTSVILVDG